MVFIMLFVISSVEIVMKGSYVIKLMEYVLMVVVYSFNFFCVKVFFLLKIIINLCFVFYIDKD